MITLTKGDRIKNLRIAKSITQTELANRLKTTKQTISKYENGIVTNIPSDRVEEMARILDTTPEYILGWEIEENEKPTVIDDGLSDDLRELIMHLKTLPDDKIQMLLQVAKSIK